MRSEGPWASGHALRGPVSLAHYSSGSRARGHSKGRRGRTQASHAPLLSRTRFQALERIRDDDSEGTHAAVQQVALADRHNGALDRSEAPRIRPAKATPYRRSPHRRWRATSTGNGRKSGEEKSPEPPFPTRAAPGANGPRHRATRIPASNMQECDRSTEKIVASLLHDVVVHDMVRNDRLGNGYMVDDVMDMRNRRHHHRHMATQIIAVHVSEVRCPMDMAPCRTAIQNVDQCPCWYDRHWRICGVRA